MLNDDITTQATN